MVLPMVVEKAEGFDERRFAADHPRELWPLAPTSPSETEARRSLWTFLALAAWFDLELRGLLVVMSTSTVPGPARRQACSFTHRSFRAHLWIGKPTIAKTTSDASATARREPA